MDVDWFLKERTKFIRQFSRIDPARNMCRFYRLDVQPDPFGGFAVVKEWGRIGARGRMMDEWHMTEAQAHSALQRQAERNAGADIASRASRRPPGSGVR